MGILVNVTAIDSNRVNKNSANTATYTQTKYWHSTQREAN